MLSDSPPDRDVEWTDAGAEGAHRFVQRIWRLVQNWSGVTVQSGSPSSSIQYTNTATELRRVSHKTLKAVGADIENLAFNRAIARIHEFVTALSAVDRKDVSDDGLAPVMREGLEFLVLCFAPVMPHLAEECWRSLGYEGLVAQQNWPDFDPSLTTDAVIVIPVQINGKKRADLEVEADADKAQIEAATLQLDVVKRFLNGKKPKKIIVVPKRIVNVVV